MRDVIHASQVCVAFDLDALIEEAVISGEIASGTPSQFLAAHGDARMVAVLGATRGPERQAAAEWTDEEDRFVLENMRWMTDAEIGARLGRSAHAVKIHRFRHLRYDARRKDPEWPNLQAVARIMGVPCQKTVAGWANQGLIAARVLPTTNGEVRAIARTELFAWASDPENWIYFKPERVADPELQTLIADARLQWQDEWWTPGQVGAYHGVTHMAINNRINLGTLPAKRWGNWWIKRSDAIALRITPRKLAVVVT